MKRILAILLLSAVSLYGQITGCMKGWESLSNILDFSASFCKYPIVVDDSLAIYAAYANGNPHRLYHSISLHTDGEYYIKQFANGEPTGPNGNYDAPGFITQINDTIWKYVQYANSGNLASVETSGSNLGLSYNYFSAPTTGMEAFTSNTYGKRLYFAKDNTIIRSTLPEVDGTALVYTTPRWDPAGSNRKPRPSNLRNFGDYLYFTECSNEAASFTEADTLMEAYLMRMDANHNVDTLAQIGNNNQSVAYMDFYQDEDTVFIYLTAFGYGHPNDSRGLYRYNSSSDEIEYLGMPSGTTSDVYPSLALCSPSGIVYYGQGIISGIDTTKNRLYCYNDGEWTKLPLPELNTDRASIENILGYTPNAGVIYNDSTAFINYRQNYYVRDHYPKGLVSGDTDSGREESVWSVLSLDDPVTPAPSVIRGGKLRCIYIGD
jgi:hypothetical protein